MFFNHKQSKELEHELAGLRQEPGAELVSKVTGDIGAAARVSPRRVWSRAAFAGALGTLVLGTLASFGGASYAAAGASQTVHSVYKISSAASAQTSASDQYKKATPQVAKVSAEKVVVVKKAKLAAPKATHAATLPFTGFSLVLTVGLSLGLILLGFVLRRRERFDS